MIGLLGNSARELDSVTRKISKPDVKGVKELTSQIHTLLSATKTMASDGSIVVTKKGFDELGKSIMEVYRNGQLVKQMANLGEGIGGG